MNDQQEHANSKNHDVNALLAALASATLTYTTDEQEAQQDGAHDGPTEMIDVYIVPRTTEEGEEEPPSVEGSLAAQGGGSDGPETPPEYEHGYRRGRDHRRLWYSLLFALVCLASAVAVCVWYIIPVFTPTVTITIFPASHTITTTQLVTVTTSSATSNEQVPGRLLSAVTMRQASTVSATGVVHQPAQAAHGTITFYNAAKNAQTVFAGTLLIGASGMQIVTEQDAVIPAGNFATNGQMTVWAHAVNAGPGGNLAPHDIDGSCCRLNVFAVNSVFHGGQDARSYQTVTQHDVDAAIATLKTSLEQSMQAALTQEVHANETLVTPLPCHPTSTADRQVGAEAEQVRVTVNETCNGIVYTTETMHARLLQGLTQEAAKQVGAGYQMAGTLHMHLLQVTAHTERGMVTLQVEATGTWMAQFSAEDLNHMKVRIVGKTRVEATALLLNMQGIERVSYSPSGDPLPGDTAHVQVVVLVYAP